MSQWWCELKGGIRGTKEIRVRVMLRVGCMARRLEKGEKKREEKKRRREDG